MQHPARIGFRRTTPLDGQRGWTLVELSISLAISSLLFLMIGSLMNRQTNAGVERGHFDSRRVANAPITRRVASRGSSARGRARSGGIRAGK